MKILLIKYKAEQNVFLSQYCIYNKDLITQRILFF